MSDLWTDSVSPHPAGPVPPATLESGTLLADRYELLRVLGVGGSSVVYEAFDRIINVPVALKLLRFDRISELATARLRREVAVARQVISPHVVRIFDVGDSVHGPFVTMELVSGHSLRELIAAGQVHVEETLRISRQVLEGLTAMHSRGIVHRDIKPGNILITPSGEVKIVDLGLARNPSLQELRATLTDTVVGTLDYLSPEQALHETVDARTDLYSFGIVLFELLTGRRPFDASSPLASILARLHDTPPPVRRFRHIPRWLNSLVAALLERDPQLRCSTAADVARLIDQRRAPRQRLTRGLVIAAITLLVLAAAAALVLQHPRPAPTIVDAGIQGMRVLSEDGTVLWSDPSTPRFNATVIRRDGKPWAIASAPQKRHAGPADRRIVLRDAWSGKVLQSLLAPDPHPANFSQFANEYDGAMASAVDIDHDGTDELVFTWVNTYWPAFSVLYEPKLQNVRIVLLSSGHHQMAMSVDVNGDGRDELIFSGVNNRLGWYAGMAAVIVPPLSDYPSTFPPSAGTPDNSYPTAYEGALAWYVLMPSGFPWPTEARLVPGQRALEVAYVRDNRKMRVSFDGFLLPDAGGDAKARLAARKGAYAALRLANRLNSGGRTSDALTEIDGAISSANSAGDRYLAEWCRRVKMQLLVRAGHDGEAQALADQLVQQGAPESDVKFELGQALHRAGRLEPAVDAYRAAALSRTDTGTGRMRYEALQGAVLAAQSAGRTAEARKIIDAYRAAYPDGGTHGNLYDSYLTWREGGTPRSADYGEAGVTDLARYWILEFEISRNGASPALLDQVAAELKRDSSAQPLTQSLYAELLWRLGRRDEARASAKIACQILDRERENDPIIEAHYDFLSSRMAKIR